MRACSGVVSWQPLLETINSRRHTCPAIQTVPWNKLQARSAWTRIIAFHGLQMYPNYLSQIWKKWNGQFHMGGYQMAVAVHTALALNVRMGEFCSMPHKLGWPYWAVCMSGLVMALVIFRSSLASLMGPWGPINSLRPCVQDTKVVQPRTDFARKSHFTKISR